MKVIIQKTAKIVVDIPENKVKDYFNGKLNEMDFIAWADQDMCLEASEPYDEDVEAWINDETTESIEIEDCPKELQSSYSKEEIMKAIDERERMEHCYECGGYGDDVFYNNETDELEYWCPNCPFNKSNYEN